MTAVRCLCCGVTFIGFGSYTARTHLCSGQTRDTANDSHPVEQTTTAPTPEQGAVVIPLSLFRRTKRATPVEPCPA